MLAKTARKDPTGTVVIRPLAAGAGSGGAPSSGHQRPQAPPLRLGEPNEPAVSRPDGFVLCTVCQTRNQLGHRFCVACGSTLPASVAPAAPTPAPPRAAQAPAAAAVPVPVPVPAPEPVPLVHQPIALVQPIPLVQQVAPASAPVLSASAGPVVPRPAAPAFGAPIGPPVETPPAAESAAPTTKKIPRPTVPAVPAAIAAAQRDSAPGPAAEGADAAGLGAGVAAPLPTSPVVALAEPPTPAVALVYCPRCQSPNRGGSLYCSVCGCSLKEASPPAPAPRAVPAAPSSRELPPESLPEEAFDTAEMAPKTTPTTPGRLVLIGKDGSDGVSYPLETDSTDIGTREGSILLKDDPYLSSRHARLIREGTQWWVIDLNSVNGVYVKLRGKRPLADGDLILLGQQVLRFEAVMDAEHLLRPAAQHGAALFGTPQTPRHARLCQRTVEGVTRDIYHLHRAETSLGRETADIVFSDDPFLSRRHAVIRQQQVTTAPAAAPGLTGSAGVAPAGPPNPGAKGFSIEDAGSSNGTFVAIRGREPLTSGDVVRVGLHVFRVEFHGGTSDTDQRGMRS
jgi:pSer/pThr/pTyr-binding forkhead associated (FHA) protein